MTLATVDFYPCDAVLARICCHSNHLSQVRFLQIRHNLGSCKQCRTIAPRNCSFMISTIHNYNGINPTGVPNVDVVSKKCVFLIGRVVSGLDSLVPEICVHPLVVHDGAMAEEYPVSGVSRIWGRGQGQEVWGMEVPQQGPGQSPSGGLGRSPPAAVSYLVPSDVRKK